LQCVPSSLCSSNYAIVLFIGSAGIAPLVVWGAGSTALNQRKR
jgi:hypothetical protein